VCALLKSRSRTSFLYNPEKSISLFEHKLPVCVSVLVFQGVRTLQQTLASNAKLFGLVAESHILFQQVDSAARYAWARHVCSQYPFFKPVFQKRNVGQRIAFETLADACSQPYIVILEEDFKAASNALFHRQLTLGLSLLQNGTHAFRLRSRKFPGKPNHAHETWLKTGGVNGGKILETHLLEYVTWEDEPERHINELHVCHRDPKTWCASSKYAQYTNNPTLYSTHFLRWLVSQVPKEGDVKFEPYLTQFWARMDFQVAYSEGLFTHDRLDRQIGELFRRVI